MSMIASLLKTPLGIAVATVHWIVVAFALLGDKVEVVYPLQVGHQLTLLQYYLLVMDFPAMLVTDLIFRACLFVLGVNAAPAAIYLAVGTGAITLQWLILGSLLQMFVDEIRAESPLTQVQLDQPEKPNQSI
jgi:hypothetical protein